MSTACSVVEGAAAPSSYLSISYLIGRGDAGGRERDRERERERERERVKESWRGKNGYFMFTQHLH